MSTHSNQTFLVCRAKFYEEILEQMSTHSNQTFLVCRAKFYEEILE